MMARFLVTIVTRVLVGILVLVMILIAVTYRTPAGSVDHEDRAKRFDSLVGSTREDRAIRR